jgi:hypothetical protein
MKIAELKYTHTDKFGNRQEFSGQAALDAMPGEVYAKTVFGDAELAAEVNGAPAPNYVDKSGRGPRQVTSAREQMGNRELDGPSEAPVADMISQVEEPTRFDVTPTLEEQVASFDTTATTTLEETPVAAQVAPEAPVAAESAAPVELPEQTYEYQITDEQGRPLGGKQIFKYRTMDELRDKLTQAHSEATRALRRTRKDLALANVEEVPADTVKYEPPTFLPTFSNEMRAELAQKVEAGDAEARRELEIDSQSIAINQQTELTAQTQINLAIQQFLMRNPGYFQCAENGTTLAAWINRRGLDMRDVRNYQKAYDVLNNLGALITSSNTQPAPITAEVPSVREETTEAAVASPVQSPAKSQPGQAEPSRITTVEPAQAKRVVVPVATGLTRNDAVAASIEPIAKPVGYNLVYREVQRTRDGKMITAIIPHRGQAALDHMPPIEYRKMLEADILQERRTGKGTGFRETVEAIEKARKVNPNQR